MWLTQPGLVTQLPFRACRNQRVAIGLALPRSLILLSGHAPYPSALDSGEAGRPDQKARAFTHRPANPAGATQPLGLLHAGHGHW
jgi:hypothetical protein